MKDNGIKIPEPAPIKAVFLERIKMANIKERYVIDEMALKRAQSSTSTALSWLLQFH